MLRLAFDFIITWRETRTRPNAYNLPVGKLSLSCQRVYVRMLNQNALLSLFLLQKFR